MPGPFVPLVLGVQILMVASNGPPTVDIRSTCATSINSVISLGGTYSETMDSCLQQQNGALEQIRKNWATYSAASKDHCIQASGYMPSYIEWLTCFEMELDVARLRKDDAGTAQANATPQARQCPIVHFQPDGSIASVINCRMVGY